MKTRISLGWRNLIVVLILAGFFTMLGLYTGMISVLLSAEMNNPWGLAMVAVVALGLLTFMDQIIREVKTNWCWYLIATSSFLIAYIALRDRL